MLKAIFGVIAGLLVGAAVSVYAEQEVASDYPDAGRLGRCVRVAELNQHGDLLACEVRVSRRQTRLCYVSTLGGVDCQF